MASVTTGLAPGEPGGEVGQLDVLQRVGHIVNVGPVCATGGAHVDEAHGAPGQRLLTVRARLDLGLVAPHALPGEAPRLAPPGQPLVPGRY